MHKTMLSLQRIGKGLANLAGQPVSRNRMDLASRLSPPDWIVQLLETQDRTIPYKDMARAALSVGVPLGLGYGFGQLPYGVLVSIGTLPGMLADRGGPLAGRFQKAALGLLGGAAGLYLGRILIGTGWPAIIAIAALALFAGLISPIGAMASFAGLQLLVYIAIGSGFVLPMPAYEFPLLFLVGGAWAILLSTIQALIEGISSPETDAVAAVYRAIAHLLESIGAPDPAPGTLGLRPGAPAPGPGSERTITAREQLTAALNNAYDQVVGARSQSQGRDRQLRWLGNMLNAAMTVAEAAVALARAGIQPAEEEIRAVSQLASVVSDGSSAPLLTYTTFDAPDPQRRALKNGIVHASRQRRAHPEHSDGPETPVGRYQALERWMTRVFHISLDTVTTRGNWLYAVRVALCMAVAEAAREVVPIQRPYWILLTVALVVKPDLGSVFARAILRGGGTVLGVVVGAGLLAIVPSGVPVLLAITILAGFLPFAMRRNYGLLATFVTPLALMLIDLATHQGASLVISRLEATLIGCGIVLVLGYLLWPETWHARVGNRVSESIDSMSSYLDSAFADDYAQRTDRRRAAYRGLSEMRTALQRMLSEPPPFNRRAAAWWPVVNGLERVADAVTEASVFARHRESKPSRSDVSELVQSLQGLRTALADGQPVSSNRHVPAQPPGITDPTLAGIRDEIYGVIGLVDHVSVGARRHIGGAREL